MVNWSLCKKCRKKCPAVKGNKAKNQWSFKNSKRAPFKWLSYRASHTYSITHWRLNVQLYLLCPFGKYRCREIQYLWLTHFGVRYGKHWASKLKKWHIKFRRFSKTFVYALIFLKIYSLLRVFSISCFTVRKTFELKWNDKDRSKAIQMAFVCICM